MEVGAQSHSPTALTPETVPVPIWKDRVGHSACLDGIWRKPLAPTEVCSVPTMYLVDTACRTHVNTTRVTREGYQMVSHVSYGIICFKWSLNAFLTKSSGSTVSVKCCFGVRLYPKRHISPLLSVCLITTEEEMLHQVSPPLLEWWSTSRSI
jgi:hypothetical protein